MSFLREWFLDLDDAPDSYTGHAGKTVKVKAGEDGLEFTAGGGGGTGHHGDLTGLAADDHPQYLLGTDGGRGTINVVAASGATETLDLADGNDHDVTLTANCTLTLAGATAGMACYMTVLLRQDGTGTRAVTWPGSVEWAGGVAPVLQTAAGAWDSVVLFTYDGGTTWFGHHTTSASGGGTAETGTHRLVILHDSGSGLEPVTDSAGLWLYGAYPGVAH